MIIHDEISLQLPNIRHRISKLVKKSGDHLVSSITVNHILSGMRNLELLISDISYVDSKDGLLLRGYSLSKILDILPKASGATMPLLGGLYYLLMVGKIPTKTQAEIVEKDWSSRASQIPKYVFKVLNSVPSYTHPMTMLSQAVLALQNNSHFEKYRLNSNKDSYWELALNDSLDLIAKLPVITAYIYRLKYFKDKKIPHYDHQLDYAQNIAKMMCIPEELAYADLTRFYFILHSDHGLGNVSAHTMHLAGSVLSSPYYAFSASLNALAGPLHGLASQESTNWLLSILKKFKGIPTNLNLDKFISQEISSGKIIPGYSHALLKVIDPRFEMLLKYANNHFPNDDLVRLSNSIFQLVSLKLSAKTANPYPNIDAVSGVLQYHYGIIQTDFYPVLFGLSRSFGLTANYVWSRAMNLPLERPVSITIKMLEQMVNKK